MANGPDPAGASFCSVPCILIKAFLEARLSMIINRVELKELLLTFKQKYLMHRLNLRGVALPLWVVWIALVRMIIQIGFNLFRTASVSIS